MKFQVQFDGQFVGLKDEKPLPAQALERFLDAVLSELSALDNVHDAKYRGSLAEGEASVSITVEAEDAGGALTLGSSAIRSALHTVKAHTPGWREHWCSVTLTSESLLIEA